MTYPDISVGTLIHDAFIPVQVPVGARPDLEERYQMHWTPTLLFLDEEGREHHRSIGFLRPEEFRPMLLLALGKFRYNRHEWDETEDALDSLLREHPDSFFAPEALYWRGVFAYKGRGEQDGLANYWSRIAERFPGTEWAEKVSFLFGGGPP